MRIAIVFLASLAVPFGGAAVGAEADRGTLVYETVWSRDLGDNLLGDGAARNVLVYLPPEYDLDRGLRYPVVYLLHGYNDTNTVWRDGAFGEFVLPGSVDRLIAAGHIDPTILVMPDARNAYGGSFYVDSPVTGSWESFIVRDLVSYIDATYRTIADRRSRGIAGHSMGGYGAVRLALRNPDVFSALYGMSACCLAMVGDIGPVNPAWSQVLAVRHREKLAPLGGYPRGLMALGAALSPNPERPPFFVDLPFRIADGEIRPNPAIYEKWLNGLPSEKLADMKEAELASLEIRFSVGRDDEFSNVLLGSRVFSEALSDKGIPHTFKEYAGDHWNRIDEVLTMDVLPFFSRQLGSRQDW